MIVYQSVVLFLASVRTGYINMVTVNIDSINKVQVGQIKLNIKSVFSLFIAPRIAPSM